MSTFGDHVAAIVVRPHVDDPFYVYVYGDGSVEVGEGEALPRKGLGQEDEDEGPRFASLAEAQKHYSDSGEVPQFELSWSDNSRFTRTTPRATLKCIEFAPSWSWGAGRGRIEHYKGQNDLVLWDDDDDNDAMDRDWQAWVTAFFEFTRIYCTAKTEKELLYSLPFEPLTESQGRHNRYLDFKFEWKQGKKPRRKLVKRRGLSSSTSFRGTSKTRNDDGKMRRFGGKKKDVTSDSSDDEEGRGTRGGRVSGRVNRSRF